MGIIVSLLLLAAGAVLAFAVDADASGVDLNAIGGILLAVGTAAAIYSLLFWSSWGGFPRHTTPHRRSE